MFMRINDVTVTSSKSNSHLIIRIKLPTKRIFRNFQVLKINTMMPFSNLFMERPSYNSFGQHQTNQLRLLKDVSSQTSLFGPP